MSGLESENHVQFPIRNSKWPESKERTTHPKEAELLQNAKILKDNGEWDLATTLLAEILTVSPDHPLAIEWMIEISEDQGDLLLARDLVFKSVRMDPDELSHFRMAECCYLEGADEEALKHYYHFLNFGSQNTQRLFQAYKNIGNIYLRVSDIESAEENYNKAYSLKPESSTLLTNYGTLEIQRSDFNAALARFREAVSYNKEDEKAWIGLALVHRQFGDHELSKANIERALDINPSNETALQLAGEWAFQDHRVRDLIERVEDSLKVNATIDQRHLVLARLYFSLNRSEESLNVLNQYQYRYPSCPLARELSSELKT